MESIKNKKSIGTVPDAFFVNKRALHTGRASLASLRETTRWGFLLAHQASLYKKGRHTAPLEKTPFTTYSAWAYRTHAPGRELYI